MKTITLITLGTESDVHYLLALGIQLQQQGHRVRLAAARSFQLLAGKVGVSFEAMPEAVEGQFPDAFFENIQKMALTSSLMVVHKPYLQIIRTLGPLPCPLMGVALQADEVFSRFNKKKGLLQRLLSRMKGSRKKSGSTHIPTLYNFSPQLLAGREEQAGTMHLTGQWAIPDSLQWKLSGRAPSPALSDWLYHGGRPVFFDFSRAPESEREKLLRLVKESSDEMGFRAIVCAGWADCEGVLQRDIFLVKSPVQEWLFRQCAAVAHYRQSDKLAAAIRAGIPSILCASGVEADSWGAILRRHGIGIHLLKEPPTAASLEAALEEALRLSMQYKATMMGKALREENGLEYAASVIGQQVKTNTVAVAV